MSIAETIKFLESGNDVDAQLATFKQLDECVTDADLPVLLASLESTNSFWVRELLAEPIIRLSGVGALPQLMKALRKNYDDGHDNDGFETFLVELAETDSAKVRAELKRLARTASGKERDDINWLLEYCQ